MDRIDRTDLAEDSSEQNAERDRDLERHASARDLDRDEANPPRTKTEPMTAPKFGSATSGGGEIEPGPERD
jgi:hypothetical protein